MRLIALVLASGWLTLTACGPTARNNVTSGGDAGATADGPVEPSCTNEGATMPCYDGPAGTEGVGPCKGGTSTCTNGFWTACQGEVVPVAEVCGDGIDNNCNGQVDEDVDADGDGYTTCGGDCCDSPADCADPVHVNPGAWDIPGDGIDNDCDGHVDNAVLVCDQGIQSQTTAGLDFAKAIDLCATTTSAATGSAKRWGVIDATFTMADGTTGTDAPNAKQHAALTKYGTGIKPHQGDALMLLSTGYAAGEGNPNYDSTLDGEFGNSSGFPADFLAAHNNKLPNAPGCPAPLGSQANDPIMLTMHVRVPTNVLSFSLDVNFLSSEFPEYTCTEYNDFFVVLLDSQYTGSPMNPTDKNLAFYKSPSGADYPVGVNLASGNTGLFTQCVDGTIGCSEGETATIDTCTSTAQLQGTGLEQPNPGSCDDNSLWGGGTGWLVTSGNVKPGEIMTLRIALWDTSDDELDSMAVIDNFRWSPVPSTPGTIIDVSRRVSTADSN